MKLVIDRGFFLKALSHGQSVVERRTTVPILSNVLLSATEHDLSLTTTDIDIALIEKIPATIQEPGSTTASAHMLYDIVRKLPDEPIHLSLNESKGQLTLKAGRSRFNLPVLPIEDFPSLTQGELPYRFTLPGNVLKGLLDRTKFAMSSEETRYYLNGIHFHTVSRGSELLFRSVATDGHRLARIEMEIPKGADGMPGIILGRKTVTELRKLLEESKADITVSLSSKRIEFAFDQVILSSRLIDGTFPDYERVIPQNNEKSLVLDVKDFAQAVDRVATVSNEKARAIKLGLSANTLVLSAASQEMGNATEELAVNYSDQPMEIGFNARYLLDIAQQIEGEHVQILLGDSGAPAIMKGVEDKQTLFVLMPMRV